MSHWIVAPTLLPALTAAYLILFARNDIFHQRIVSVAAIEDIGSSVPPQPVVVGAAKQAIVAIAAVKHISAVAAK